MLNLHGKIVNLKSDELRNYSISKSKKLLRKLTHHYPCIKVRLQLWTRTEPYYSNTLVFSQIRGGRFKAYCESIRCIITENMSEHKTVRRENWTVWSQIAVKNGLHLIWP